MDDFHPRVQRKAIFTKNNAFFDNPDNAEEFAKKYVVTEDAIKMYVNHMKLLSLRKEKRSEQKAQQREEEAGKMYEDYDWEGIFNDRSLSKLKLFELDNYIAHHNLGKYGTKNAKLEAIKKNIIKQLFRRIDEEDNEGSEDESNNESGDDSEEDCVLAEIGVSSSEEEKESEEEIESTGNFNVNTSIEFTRSGRRATRFWI